MAKDSAESKGSSRTGAADGEQRTQAMPRVQDDAGKDTAAKGADIADGTADAPSDGNAGAAGEKLSAKDRIAARVGAVGAARRSSSRTPSRKGAQVDREDVSVPGGPRRVRLTLASVDPFSVMKLSFIISIAIGIATVVAVAVLWSIIDVIGLWDQMDELGRSLNRDEPLPFMAYFEFSKFFSYGVIVAVVNIVVITALGTLLAFLYNIVARLLGGLKMTFTDE